ncbi:MAG: hypothetical protein R2682_14590 [Pyrinomonadaceae bacterium]
MKKVIFVCLVVVLSQIGVQGQAKMSDKDMNGVKGPVRSMREEYQTVRVLETKGKKPDYSRKTFQEVDFDESGRITTIRYTSGSVLVFDIVDGFKAFHSIEKDTEKAKPPSVKTMRGQAEPLDKEEKLTPPDPRYQIRYVYEYDKNGRIKTEKEYGNTGELFRTRSFEYDDNGNVSKMREETSGAIEKHKYKYDKNGLLVEDLSERNIKGPGSDSTDRSVYSDYKVDDHGNWVERRKTYHSEIQGLPEYNIKPSKWDIERLEFRSFVYF